MQFKRIYVEISNICNLSCPFCSPLKRAKASMSLDDFIYILDEIKPFCNFIYLHVKGEPLLHQYLKECLEICHNKGFSVNITTNATLLNQKKSILLSSPALRQVNISLHSFDEQPKDIISDYLYNIFYFAEKCNEQEIYTVLRLWNLDKSRNISSSGLYIMQKIQQEYNIEYSLKDIMHNKKSIQIKKNIFLDWEEEFVWPSLQHDFVSDFGTCYGMRYQVAILVDGTVTPCCLDSNGEAKLGNVFDTSFSDIVNSYTAKKIKHGFEKNIAYHELCKRCTFKNKFIK